ncbi:sensory histidine kinase UhpB [compost metagenome]
MLIEDNGQGFVNQASGRSRGLGLRNMQERMEHFGGSLDVRTTSKGTTLKARLPKSTYITQHVDPVPA